ncbi:MAG: VIT and vWA domain-containing protein, partial [Chitinophagales bacterium]
MKKIFSLFLLLTCFPIVSSFAGGFMMVSPEDYYWRPTERISKYLKVFPDDFNPHTTEFWSEKANIEIADGVATTELTQTFYNPSMDTVQAYFLLPIPKNLPLEDFEMKIADRTYRADLYTDAQAHKVIEEMVRRTKNPRYWEFANQNLYKVTIYTFTPRSLYTMRIKYKQKLPQDDNKTFFAYNMSSQSFYKPLREFDLNIHIKAPDGQKIKQFYSTSHAPEDLEFQRKGDNEGSIVISSRKQPNQTKNLSFYFSTATGKVDYALYPYKEAGEDGYFMLSFDAGYVSDASITEKDVLFVLDASAEMGTANLEASKKALTEAIKQLHTKDRFNIIRYSDEVEKVFDTNQAANSTNIGKATTFLNATKLGGKSNMEAALKASIPENAEKVHPYFVVFINGSEASVGASSDKDLLTLVKDISLRNLHFYTIGMGKNTHVHLLDQIASHTSGESHYILADEKVAERIGEIYNDINDPIVVNLHIYDIENFDVIDSYPSNVRNLFKNRPLSVIGRYKNAGKTKISMTGSGNGDLQRFDMEFDLPEENMEYPYVKRLWAARSVAAQLDKIRLEGDEDWMEQIAEVAHENGIVSPYSNYVILDEGYYDTDFEPAVSFFADEDAVEADFEAMKQPKGEGSMRASSLIQKLHDVHSLLSLHETAANSTEVKYIFNNPFYKTT